MWIFYLVLGGAALSVSSAAKTASITLKDFGKNG